MADIDTTVGTLYGDIVITANVNPEILLDLVDELDAVEDEAAPLLSELRAKLMVAFAEYCRDEAYGAMPHSIPRGTQQAEAYVVGYLNAKGIPDASI